MRAVVTSHRLSARPRSCRSRSSRSSLEPRRPGPISAFARHRSWPTVNSPRRSADSIASLEALRRDDAGQIDRGPQRRCEPDRSCDSQVRREKVKRAVHDDLPGPKVASRGNGEMHLARRDAVEPPEPAGGGVRHESVGCTPERRGHGGLCRRARDCGHSVHTRQHDRPRSGRDLTFDRVARRAELDGLVPCEHTELIRGERFDGPYDCLGPVHGPMTLDGWDTNAPAAPSPAQHWPVRLPWTGVRANARSRRVRPEARERGTRRVGHQRTRHAVPRPALARTPAMDRDTGQRGSGAARECPNQTPAELGRISRSDRRSGCRSSACWRCRPRCWSGTAGSRRCRGPGTRPARHRSR